MSRTSPLRKVKRRNRDRSEVLECGHEHPGSYKAARRRRCHGCFLTQARTAIETLTIQAQRDRSAMAPGPDEIADEDIEAALSEHSESAQVAPALEATLGGSVVSGAPGPRCTYCLDNEGALVACAACRTLTHSDCRRALRRCPTLGCVAQTTTAAAQPSRIVIQGLPVRVGRARWSLWLSGRATPFAVILFLAVAAFYAVLYSWNVWFI